MDTRMDIRMDILDGMIESLFSKLPCPCSADQKSMVTTRIDSQWISIGRGVESSSLVPVPWIQLRRVPKIPLNGLTPTITIL